MAAVAPNSNAARAADNAVKLGSTTDLLGLYDRYIRKFSPEFPDVVVDGIGPANGYSLVVVDMQRDFILPGGPRGPGSEIGGKNGRFSVTSGESVVKPLCKFIRDHGDKFRKIIFTRDAHPSNHCSFFTQEGAYPPHCVINHIGAGIHEDFKEFSGKENVDVVFKGMYQDADSYGGIDYPKDDYRDARQKASGGKCCQGAVCMDGEKDKTGGRYLVDRAKGFVDFPFTGVQEYRDNDLTQAGVCPESLFENIRDQLGEPFKIEDLLGDQTVGTHTVFVVGLAGDYCVKDTAINLAKKARELDGIIMNVVVIEPFTRYPTLPIAIFTGKGKKSSNYTAIPAEGEMRKNINDYLLESNNAGELRRLRADEVAGANLVAGGYKYHAFINGIRPLLGDYLSAGVKLLMNVPNVAVMEGGARRRRHAKSRRLRGGHKRKATRRHRSK